MSHSFGARSDSGGSYAWFHFLCKHIRLTTGPGNAVGIAYRNGADRAGMEARALAEQQHGTARRRLLPKRATEPWQLPQADYSYLRSGFFLRTAADGGTTLVCFGATAGVRARIDEFVEAKTWKDVTSEPYILFDLVLEGLFRDVDQNCWNMNTIFGALEHVRRAMPRKTVVPTQLTRRKQTLASGNSKKSMITKDMFIGLHNLAKHMTHLAEAIQSCSSVAEEILSRVKTAEPGPGYGLSRTGSGGSSSTLSPNEVHQQLRDCIQYRRSLFQSTNLRLASMQKRVENTINLSFNLVTQQDSVIMIQDSNSMKIIAVITMLFLPTTAVASVVGSQLFTATKETGTWIVEATPLFAVMWYITAPLTVVVLILAALWIKYMRQEERENSKELLRRLMNISSKLQPLLSAV